MRIPQTFGAYGMTLVLGMFGATSLLQQCQPAPTPAPSVAAPTPTSPPVSPSTAAPSAPTGAVPTDNCVTLVNQERASRGLGALSVDGDLVAAAQNHSAYQAQNGTMSHTGSGGTNAGQRITAEGYQWSWWAENVAAGQSDCASVVGAWMASSGHRANILNGNLKDIGVGVALSSNGALYWTMDFASRR